MKNRKLKLIINKKIIILLQNIFIQEERAHNNILQQLQRLSLRGSHVANIREHKTAGRKKNTVAELNHLHKSWKLKPI